MLLRRKKSIISYKQLYKCHYRVHRVLLQCFNYDSYQEGIFYGRTKFTFNLIADIQKMVSYENVQTLNNSAFEKCRFVQLQLKVNSIQN